MFTMFGVQSAGNVNGFQTYPMNLCLKHRREFDDDAKASGFIEKLQVADLEFQIIGAKLHHYFSEETAQALRDAMTHATQLRDLTDAWCKAWLEKHKPVS